MRAQAEQIMRRNLPLDSFWFGLLASGQALLESGRGNSQQALSLADGRDRRALDYSRPGTCRSSRKHPASPCYCRTCGRAAYASGRRRGPHSVPVSGVRSPSSSYIGTAYLEFGNALQAEAKAGETHSAYRSSAQHLEKTLGANHRDTRSARPLAGLEIANNRHGFGFRETYLTKNLLFLSSFPDRFRFSE
jgi:hypothetical protein